MGAKEHQVRSAAPLALAILAIAAAVVLLRLLEPAVPVRAVTAQRGTIQSVVSTNGKVEPLQNFEAHAPVGTTVKKIFVREGDHVKKGQLLVQLNDADARSQAARAQAQVLAADADLSAVQRGGNREEVLTLDSQLLKARAMPILHSATWIRCSVYGNRAPLRRVK